MISAPLEAQIRSPQAQFAANHLFASASAGHSTFSAGLSLSTSAPFGFADSDSLAAADTHHNLMGDYDEASAGHPRPRKSDTTPVAPFRKGMDEEELAPVRPDPEDDEAASTQLAEAQLDAANGSNLHSPRHKTPTAASPATTAMPSPAPSAAKTKDGKSAVAFPTSSASGIEPPSAIQSTSDYPRLRLVSETTRPVTRARMRSLRTIAQLDPNQASALIRSHFHGNGRAENTHPSASARSR